MTLRKFLRSVFLQHTSRVPVEKCRSKCSMAKWNKCGLLSRQLTLNEMSWVMTANLDVPAYEPVAWADAGAVAWADTGVAGLASPTSGTSLSRKLSNRVSATTSRANKKLYVAGLEARVLALEQGNAELRAQLREAELENMLLLAEAVDEHMLSLD